MSAPAIAAAPSVAAPAAPLDHAAIRSIVIGIGLAMFLGALDQTIVATALPTIGRRFGDVENLSWVVTAYLLTATAMTPLFGKLSDIHGRRAMLHIGIGVFVLGSIACALAPSMGALIAARALQGLGAGGILPLSQTIIGDVVAPRERGRYQGYIGLVFAVASISGPVLGGFFAEHLDWSLIFWINVPLGLLAFLMTNRVLRRLPRHERRHRLDYLGAALMIAASVTLLLALTWGGSRFAWTSPAIATILACSLALWLLFTLRMKTAVEPFLPSAVLANPVVSSGTAAAASAYGVMIGLSIYVPLYFEVVLHLSASQSGLALIPLMGGTVFGSTFSGQLMSRVTHYRRLPVMGMLFALVGVAALAWAPGALPMWAVGTALGAVGLGLGSLFPVTTVSVQNAVLPWQLGTATAVMNFFRQLAGSVVVALFGAVILGMIGAHSGAAIEILTAAVGRAGVDTAGIFRVVFAAAGVILVAGLGCLLLMEEKPLRTAVAPTPAPQAAE